MMKWLSNIPVIGMAVQFVLGKGRLLLDYALIAAMITFAAVCVTLWAQNKSLKTDNVNLNVRVNSVETANQWNVETIESLQKARQSDEQVIAALSRAQQSLSKSDGEVRRRITELEKRNEIVKQYLDTPIPPELACVLYNTCKTGDPDKNRDTSAPSLPTRALLPPAGKSSPSTTDTRPR